MKLRIREGLYQIGLWTTVIVFIIVNTITLPARAQSPPSGGETFVGLPPPPTLVEVPHRLPDGSTKSTTRGGDHPSRVVIVSQIHNAPGWLPNTAYTAATAPPYTRVNSGLGWNPSTQQWVPGQPLAAYQLASASTCTSGKIEPAGTGDAIQDGTCTWRYLSATDYVTLTGWMYDNQAWVRGTTYHFFDIATAGSPLRVYALTDNSCASTVAPAGNGFRVSSDWLRHITPGADGCHWDYLADILYTSRKSYIPTGTFTSSTSIGTIQMKVDADADLWNDREYIAGENGEMSPIVLKNHLNNWHGGGEGGQMTGCNTPGAAPGSPMVKCPNFWIEAAPGESFRDTLTPTEPLAGYDPSRGVAIRDPATYVWPYEPAALLMWDPFTHIIGLQLKSDHGAAYFGYNQDTISDSILDGGSRDPWTSHTAVFLDAGPDVIANSLVITHGSAGVVFKYPGFVLHSTVVDPERAGDVGVETGNKWVFNNTTVSNSAIFGFAHAGAAGNPETAFSSQSSNNVTDAPSGDSGSTTWMGSKSSALVVDIPNTNYGASASAAFVVFGSDWRAKSGGPLVGAGSAFGDFTTGCSAAYPNCANKVVYNFDTSDIVGTARSQRGKYDIGAWQS